MQTLFLGVADCPTGKLAQTERYRLDAAKGRIFGATLIAAEGEAVADKPGEDDEGSLVSGYNFNAGHVDANCPTTLANATSLFGLAAADLGSGETPDPEIVYALVKPHIKPRTFSKLYLELALAELGLIDALDAWLASFEVKPGYTAARAFDRANDISEVFPGFDKFFAAAKRQFGITDAQAESILAQCVVEE